MKNELSDAFVDSPPCGLPALSQKTLLLIDRAVKRAGLALDSVEMIGAYFCIGEGNIQPKEQEITDAFVSLSDEEVDQITGYINRVMERREKADVQIADTPGK